MNFKKILLIIYSLACFILYPTEYFKGYSSSSTSNSYSILSLLESKWDGNKSKWNENYFHDAQFPDQGITIFTNIIFSKTFLDKNGCKFNCIITFNDKSKYTFNKDYDPKNIVFKDKGFSIAFEKNFIELKDNIYKVHLENNDIKLDLNYKSVNPPHIFGDGLVSLDESNYLAFSQPIVGAYVTGNLSYQNKNIKLNGRGSVGHDYSALAPLKAPRKWRSFWFYKNEYSIVVHTVIFNNKTQLDRIVVYKDGKLLKSFLNSGLKTTDFIYDKNNKFSYPTRFIINYTENPQAEIDANITLNKFTDKIQVFENLTPALHSVVSLAVGEMWAYRFWAEAEFAIKINGKKETVKITGIGNYVDMGS